MQNILKQTFFVDWEQGVSGIMKDNTSIAKNDFAMRITAFIEAGNSTGYMCTVKREHDGKTK